MKKVVLVVGFTLIGLCSVCAESWIGLEIAVLKPNESNFGKHYNPFVGWGFNSGFIFKKHFEVGLEGTQLFSKKGVTDVSVVYNYGDTTVVSNPKEDIINYAIQIKPSYRLRPGYSPYVGISLGYNARITKTYSDYFFGGMIPISSTTHSFILDPFIGFNLPILPYFGLRLEGKYRALSTPDGSEWALATESRNTLRGALLFNLSFNGIFR